MFKRCPKRRATLSYGIPRDVNPLKQYRVNSYFDITNCVSWDSVREGCTSLGTSLEHLLRLLEKHTRFSRQTCLFVCVYASVSVCFMSRVAFKYGNEGLRGWVNATHHSTHVHMHIYRVTHATQLLSVFVCIVPLYCVCFLSLPICRVLVSSTGEVRCMEYVITVRFTIRISKLWFGKSVVQDRLL